MSTVEQELIERIMQLDAWQQRRVLEFIDSLDDGDFPERHYTAKDLMRLPPEERERIARIALERALGGNFED